jgi:hypothetical protein
MQYEYMLLGTQFVGQHGRRMEYVYIHEQCNMIDLLNISDILISLRNWYSNATVIIRAIWLANVPDLFALNRDNMSEILPEVQLVDLS